MKKIYKYPLGRNGEIAELTGHFTRGLTVQAQNGMPHIWIEIDEESPEVTISVVAVGTGWEIPDELCENYLGSVQDGFGYVWHYYWVPGTISVENPESNTPLR